MNCYFLDTLVCPICKSTLVYDKNAKCLICRADKLSYPIVKGVPRMTIKDAKIMSIEEVKKYG